MCHSIEYLFSAIEVVFKNVDIDSTRDFGPKFGGEDACHRRANTLFFQRRQDDPGFHLIANRSQRYNVVDGSRHISPIT